MARLVRLVAVLSLVSVFTRPEGPDRGALVDALRGGVSLAAVIVSASTMLVVARALARRKRRAWRLVLGLVLLSAALYLRQMDWAAGGLNLAMAALLVWTRNEFHARSEPRSRWLALRAGLIASSVALVTGVALSARVSGDVDSWSVVRETVRGLLGFTPDLPFRRAVLGDLTGVALTGLGAATAGIVLVILLAPRRKPAVLAPDDEARVRGLLARHGGGDSLGYFAVRRDKSAVFSASGKAAVTYRVVGDVSLASGDPIGDPEAWPGAIAAWLAEARDYAWTPGVLGASQAGACAYVRAGLDALEIGDEAVLDLTSFSLAGREMRPIRQAVSRVTRAGYTVTVHRQRDLPRAELVAAARAADALRDGEVERGFSMALGRIGDPADGDVVLVRAFEPDGTLVALLSLVPWGPDGLSLDVMRRSRASENGTMEFLVAAVAERAESFGVQRLSLNFAVFRSALERGAQVGAGPVLRVWRSLLVWLSRWWQIESLYRANAKYHPDWVPRLVCFPRAADLPRVAMAALQAEAFVVWPSLSRWLRPRR
jgi:lysyl-tRNA synthetase, class II